MKLSIKKKRILRTIYIFRPGKPEVNEICVRWSCECDLDTTETVRRQASSQWLRTVLLDKLVNWSQVNNELSTEVTSLQLVEVDKYKEEYIRLKNLYGRSLVEVRILNLF